MANLLEVQFYTSRRCPNQYHPPPNPCSSCLRLCFYFLVVLSWLVLLFRVSFLVSPSQKKFTPIPGYIPSASWNRNPIGYVQTQLKTHYLLLYCTVYVVGEKTPYGFRKSTSFHRFNSTYSQAPQTATRCVTHRLREPPPPFF